MTTPHEPVALCQTPGSFPSHSPPLHSRSLKQSSKDCWHLVEALGSAIWPHLHCILEWQRVEKLKTSDFPLPGWIFLRFYLPYEFCYTHRHHSNSFRNFSVFYPILLIICMYSHLGQSSRQFTLGTLFIQVTQYCPPVTKKLNILPWDRPQPLICKSLFSLLLICGYVFVVF